MQGKLITIEGVDGAGKTTVIKNVLKRLSSHSGLEFIYKRATKQKAPEFIRGMNA